MSARTKRKLPKYERVKEMILALRRAPGAPALTMALRREIADLLVRFAQEIAEADDVPRLRGERRKKGRAIDWDKWRAAKIAAQLVESHGAKIGDAVAAVINRADGAGHDGLVAMVKKIRRGEQTPAEVLPPLDAHVALYAERLKTLKANGR